MSSCAERLLLLALCLVSVACPASHVCESAELCNGRDDDCDGHTDEGFIDARGRYTGDAHCGRCGVACDQVFASASETACDASGTVPMCTILACAPGSHRAGQGGCVADTYVQCLPCRDDNECAAHTPGARCLDAGGERRCGARCGDGVPCPSPFVCDTALGQCFPELSLCACDKVAASFEVACLGEGAASQLACAGLRTCSARGPSVCVIATAEACNLRDDDCDGQIDEDFLDDGGLYVDRLHCGGCGLPCAAPGPNYRAECLVTGPGARCRVACEAGFVDVDGIEGNGCECQLVGDTTAPRAVGGDANCDGVIDDNDVFVHVAPSGSDKGLGTLVSPLRTIAAAMARGKAENKSVLVAQGSYPPVQIVGGVRVFGGYRTDFLERDPERYPVRIEADGTGDGAPVLTCGDVTQATLIDGVTLVGQDAVTPGLGSTTALFDGCGPDVKLAHVSILAGRGAVGERGADASGRLPPGFSSLSDLDGTSGVSGRAGDSDREQCVAQPGGAGGPKLCGRVNVGGGSGGAASCGATGCSNGRACGNAGCSDFSVAGVCDYDQVLAQAVANPSAEDARGLVPGAAGRPTYNAPTSRGTCSFCDDNPSLERLGQDGSDGRAGDRGPAGVGCADGPLLFDAVGRASASRGSAGAAGSHGSGGGGGSAGNGYDVIPGTRGSCDDNAGGSGAGAGSGGCGAPGGGGGGGGGASIALAVRVTAAGAGPTFEAVRVVTASGGRGGDGGLGAAGGVGGVGALGGLARFWCTRNGGRGGDGGAGGAGGGGGGGCGGASHALVVRGTASPEYRATAREALTVAQAGVAGRGGAGGFSPGFTGSDGEPGRSDAIR